jgi:hypothetical protein
MNILPTHLLVKAIVLSNAEINGFELVVACC